MAFYVDRKITLRESLVFKPDDDYFDNSDATLEDVIAWLRKYEGMTEAQRDEICDAITPGGGARSSGGGARSCVYVVARATHDGTELDATALAFTSRKDADEHARRLRDKTDEAWEVTEVRLAVTL